MQKKLLNLSVLAASVLLCSTAFAEEFATAKEAEAMVTKTVKALNADRAGTLAAITAKDKAYVDRDLYAVVYDLNGKCLAHGQNEKQVGKDLIDVADADGKEYMKERVAMAKTKTKFSHDYKFRDPITKKVLPKEAFCEKTGESIVCAGVYKR